MKTERSKCDCGKVKAKNASRCKQCYDTHFAKIHAEAQKIVSAGNCPCCGSGLVRNSSIAGWWQCEQYGTAGFRKDANKPACAWQTFTE